jgi:hypothetical protein
MRQSPPAVLRCVTNTAEVQKPLPLAVAFPRGKEKATYPGAFDASGMQKKTGNEVTPFHYGVTSSRLRCYRATAASGTYVVVIGADRRRRMHGG